MFINVVLMFLVLVGSVSGLGLIPSRKTWWAKQVTSDMYVAGRLTETQVKYASEVGFKSIIAIPTYTSASSIGEEVFPDSPRLAELAVNQCGMFYDNVMEPGDDWASMETVTKFTSIVDTAPPPYLITCNSFTSSAFNALAYLANQTRLNRSFTPKVDSSEFYKRAASMGLSFNQPKVTALVSDLTGEAEVTNPLIADIALSNWPMGFWLAKPYSKYVFVSGQIRSNYLDLIGGSGFKVIINSRKGVTTQPSNEPSQEEVTLLNIKDKTGTGRQRKRRLLKSRIDPNKPNEYIGAGSQVNYASMNHLEYGDDVGYNETMMRLDIKQRLPGVSYFHTPIGGQYKYTKEMWDVYKDIWIGAVQQNQPVLFVCTVAYRATVSALLTIGTIEKRDSKWALEEAKAQGYHFEQARADGTVNLFQEVLDKQNEASNSNHLAPFCSLLAIPWLATVVLFL